MSEENRLDDAVYGAFDDDEQRALEDAVLSRIGVSTRSEVTNVVALPRRRGLRVASAGAACALAAASLWFAFLPGAPELPAYRLIPPSVDAAQRGADVPAAGRYGLERELALVLRPARESEAAATARVYARHDGRLVPQPATLERDPSGALRLRVRPARDGQARAGATWQLRVLVGRKAELDAVDLDASAPPAGVQVFELALPLD